MNSITFPKINASSEVKQIAIKMPLAAKLKVFFNSAIAKLLLTIAVGSIAWFSWRPTLYQLYQIDHHFIVEELAQSSNTELRKAATYFKQENYNTAAMLVAKHYRSNPNDVEVAKKYALVLITSNELETAKSVLYPIYRNENMEIKSFAAYALALIALKQEKNTACHNWLTKVSKNTNYYRQSQELLTTLANVPLNQQP